MAHEFESRTLRGLGIAPGYGEGSALVLRVGAVPAPQDRQIDPAAVAGEIERLDTAIGNSRSELAAVQERVREEIGEDVSLILGSHLALLQDSHFIGHIRRRIVEGLDSAETAVEGAAAELAARFAALDDEYLRERGQDILDIKARLHKHLGHGVVTLLGHLPPDTVLIATDLLPSETLDLDRAHVAAIVLERGGPTSHAAILARAMGIPAVGHVEQLLDRVTDGAGVLVDGQEGIVVVDPDPQRCARFASAQRSYLHDNAEMVRQEWKRCATRDRHAVTLLANLGRPAEIDQVLRHRLDGIGLFRTEYLFIRSEQAPTLDTQRQVYVDILERAGSLPVVIRTMDLGGDKQPRFALSGAGEKQRFGMRGLRLSLHERDLFRTQLQAIVEATRGRHDVSIMLPMVLSGEDLAAAMAVIEAVCADAGLSRRPSVGAVVETPSALFEIDEILSLADFVSIGTNDLVQFMLAIERRSAEAMTQDALFQPAVLRAVARVTERAAAFARPVTVCGEAAGDPLAALLLVGLGVDRLSMSPVRAARVRTAIRAAEHDELVRCAHRALGAHSRAEVTRILRRVAETIGAAIPVRTL